MQLGLGSPGYGEKELEQGWACSYTCSTCFIAEGLGR